MRTTFARRIVIPTSLLISTITISPSPTRAVVESPKPRPSVATATPANELDQQKRRLLDKLKKEAPLADTQTKQLETLMFKSHLINQGNPSVTKYAMSEEACLANAKKANVDFQNKKSQEVCGHSYMSPLYDLKKEKPEDATVCIDKFEFPNLPCTYPLVWTRADEAQEICKIMGKRLCDAHEWEGACAGDTPVADYFFEEIKNMPAKSYVEMSKVVKHISTKHNAKRRITWSYGPNRNPDQCAEDSFKHQDCNGGDWKRCGSNTYPSGSFLGCKSPYDVYDIHGNAAEHMNLPLKPDEMATGDKLGVTEMKGSWFIFKKFAAHTNDCHWRAPFWHGTRVKDAKSHNNYHLGFRCCSDVKSKK